MIGDLSIGITSWNSAFFLELCLDAIRENSRGIRTQTLVLDNQSTDRTEEVARKAQCEFVTRKCSQSEALSWLHRKSKAKYTLLIHADVILLNPDWFQLCLNELTEDCVLVSPEDIGCGPFTRPFGAGMPESSFMFFDSFRTQKMKTICRGGRFGRLWRPREFDFFGPHVTHRIPSVLSSFGKTWKPMHVLMSPTSSSAVFQPAARPNIWTDELAVLKYGLGNFYSLNGMVTHYHNWSDRISAVAVNPTTGTIESDGKGFSVDYIRACSQRFKDDYLAGCVDIPAPTTPARKPMAL